MKLTNSSLDEVHLYALSLCDELNDRDRKTEINALHREHFEKLLEVIRELEAREKR